MIDTAKRYADIYIGNKDRLIRELPGFAEDYLTLFKFILSHIKEELEEYGSDFIPNVEKIHVIDDGDYQGIILFVVPEDTYQPSSYLTAWVDYGSCSGCDTLEHIKGDIDGKTSGQELWTLGLHMIQSIKIISARG